MTEERRKDVVKEIGARVEDANVAFRQIRHDVLNGAKAAKNDGDISEDDQKRIEKQVDEMMNSFRDQAKELAANKETEVMTV